MSKHLSFDELLSSVDYDYGSLTYYELLDTIEWNKKRQEIFKRDGYQCNHCKNGETISKRNNIGIKENFWIRFPENIKKYKNYYMENSVLKEFNIYDERDLIFEKAQLHSILHLHHKYYIKGVIPWEYEDKCFMTLCVHCHFKLHEKQIIQIYLRTTDGLIKKMNLTPCKRCNGAGILPHFDYVMGGICFRCFGAKFEQLISEKFKKRSKEIADKMKNKQTIVT